MLLNLEIVKCYSHLISLEPETNSNGTGQSLGLLLPLLSFTMLGVGFLVVSSVSPPYFSLAP